MGDLESSHGVRAVNATCLFERDAFFAGEKVYCDICIQFPQQPRNDTATSFFLFSMFSQPPPTDNDSDILEYIAVQLHGHEAHDPRLVMSACDQEDEEQDDRNKQYLTQEEEDEEELEAIAALRTPVSAQNRINKKPELIHRGSEGQIVVRRTSSGSAIVETYQTDKENYQRAKLSLGMPDMKFFSGNYGATLFASPIHIMAKHLRVLSGTERRYQFDARLPPILPPTYQGTSVRYWYLITVGLKFASSPIVRHFSFPVHVLGLGREYNQGSDSSPTPTSPSLKASSTPNALRRQPLNNSENGHTPMVLVQETNNNNNNTNRISMNNALIAATTPSLVRLPQAAEGENITRALKFPREYPNHRYACKSRELTSDYINGRYRVLTNGNPAEKETLASNLRYSRGPGRALTVVDPNLGGLRLRPRINSDAPSLPRPPVSVNIASGDGHVARFTLRKSFVSPGEDFLIAFDFANAKVRCYKVIVSIETEERGVASPPLQAAFAPLSRQLSSTSVNNHHNTSSNNINNNNNTGSGSGVLVGNASADSLEGTRNGNLGESTVGPGPWCRLLVSREYVVSSHALASMILTLPIDATPDFASDLVLVHSFLRLEFCVAKTPFDANNDDDPLLFSKDPQNLIKDQSHILKWRLPLHIRPWSFLLRERVSSGIGW